MTKLEKLKKEARRFYLEATSPSPYGCGLQLADYIQGGPRASAEAKFNKTWEKIKALDPGAPDSPFSRREGA